MAEGGAPILEVDSLVAGYGKKHVLRGVSLRVARGEIVALIGHNGAGKSTLLKTIMGMLPTWSGSIRCQGRIIKDPKPHEMIRAGVTYVPQGNRVFGDITVQDNLRVASISLPQQAARRIGIDRALAAYPVLKTRMTQRASTLSGGEKQMLALAMSLVLSPELLLLDEPSLGLAPPLAVEALNRVSGLSREIGVSVLIVEQKVRSVLKVAHRVYVLRNGAVSFTGPAASLSDDVTLHEVYL